MATGSLCSHVYRSFGVPLRAQRFLRDDGVRWSGSISRRTYKRGLGPLLHASETRGRLGDVKRCKIFGGGYHTSYTATAAGGSHLPVHTPAPRSHENGREKNKRLWYKSIGRSREGVRFSELLQRHRQPMEKVGEGIERALSLLLYGGLKRSSSCTAVAIPDARAGAWRQAGRLRERRVGPACVVITKNRRRTFRDCLASIAGPRSGSSWMPREHRTAPQHVRRRCAIVWPGPASAPNYPWIRLQPNGFHCGMPTAHPRTLSQISPNAVWKTGGPVAGNSRRNYF
jgi:hypothetical protein